jgi:hypothetical protein
MINSRIGHCLLGVFLILFLISAPVNADTLGPEYVYDPDSKIPTSPPVQTPAEDPPIIEINNAPVTYQFNMDTSQFIALINSGTGLCETGAPLVTRFWATTPIILQPTANTELSVTLDATTIPLNSGFPIINILLYNGPRDGLDYCIGLMDTTSKNTAGSFAGSLQQPGETYTFTDPQTGNPIILQAGQNYYLYAHTAATFDSGTADVTFVFANEPSTPIPTLSEWGMIIFSLLLAGSAIWMIRRRQVA